MISIGIPCYNESRNLAALLDDVLAQRCDDDLECIVVDDCSTDDTAAIVRRYASRDDRVRLVSHEKRSGSTAAWNSIFASARGVVLIKIDGDVRLADRDFVRAISAPLVRADDAADLAYCAVLPRDPPKTWVERGTAFMYAYIARQNSLGRWTSASLFCALLAIRRDRYADFVIPEEVIANDYYTARYAQARGWRIAIVDSTVTIKPSARIQDFRKQARRAATAHEQVRAIFGPTHRYLSKSIPAIVLTALRDPLGAVSFLILRRELKTDDRTTAIWEIADSTK